MISREFRDFPMLVRILPGGSWGAYAQPRILEQLTLEGARHDTTRSDLNGTRSVVAGTPGRRLRGIGTAGPDGRHAVRNQRKGYVRSSEREARAVTTAPARTSLWPFRYFVAEWTTRSAPNSMGRVKTGVAAVLSTATRTSTAWAISATAARSVTSHIGLAGVSTHRRRVRPGGWPQSPGRGSWCRRTRRRAPTRLRTPLA